MAEVMMLTPLDGVWINNIATRLHENQRQWWEDLETGQPIERNVGEVLCLIHSEISEALEGHRKGLMDDKLPHRPQIEVELADAVIRIFDFCAAKGLDIGGAIVEKTDYNAKREDHKRENRLKPGGKKY